MGDEWLQSTLDEIESEIKLLLKPLELEIKLLLDVIESESNHGRKTENIRHQS